MSSNLSNTTSRRSLAEPIPDTEVPAGCQVRALAATGEAAGCAEGEREVWCHGPMAMSVATITRA